MEISVRKDCRECKAILETRELSDKEVSSHSAQYCINKRSSIGNTGIQGMHGFKGDKGLRGDIVQGAQGPYGRPGVDGRDGEHKQLKTFTQFGVLRLKGRRWNHRRCWLTWHLWTQGENVTSLTQYVNSVLGRERFHGSTRTDRTGRSSRQRRH